MIVDVMMMMKMMDGDDEDDGGDGDDGDDNHDDDRCDESLVQYRYTQMSGQNQISGAEEFSHHTLQVVLPIRRCSVGFEVVDIISLIVIIFLPALLQLLQSFLGQCVRLQPVTILVNSNKSSATINPRKQHS